MLHLVPRGPRGDGEGYEGSLWSSSPPQSGTGQPGVPSPSASGSLSPNRPCQPQSGQRITTSSILVSGSSIDQGGEEAAAVHGSIGAQRKTGGCIRNGNGAPHPSEHFA